MSEVFVEGERSYTPHCAVACNVVGYRIVTLWDARDEVVTPKAVESSIAVDETPQSPASSMCRVLQILVEYSQFLTSKSKDPEDWLLMNLCKLGRRRFPVVFWKQHMGLKEAWGNMSRKATKSDV